MSLKRPSSEQASETAKWLGSRAWNCPTTRPKNNSPNKGGPQTLNLHKFPFIEVPPIPRRNRGVASSVRVMEKAGMRREGHFIQNQEKSEEWKDSFLYAVLADEWSVKEPFHDTPWATTVVDPRDSKCRLLTSRTGPKRRRDKGYGMIRTKWAI
jgi:hypothetical protein